MNEIPFSKREPRFTIQPPKLEIRGPFDAAYEFTIPQNKQMCLNRKIRFGNNNNCKIKSNNKFVDSMENYRSRHFEVLKSELPTLKLYKTNFEQPFTCRNPKRFDTMWISHAEKNTSLSPRNDEMFTTSYLNSFSEIDRYKKNESIKSQRIFREKRDLNTAEYHRSITDKINKRTAAKIAKKRQNEFEYHETLRKSHNWESIKTIF